ncbi:ABC transporter ATP-binding protein/permease [Paenibacillus oenotherae]|uniref:ABC transporter ATP-binding protein/permease n=1 Tax=Paenibacillus oenotherae TaxID=1435645 RepID=A0ABS7DA44_9BACL|nr:ABC transporter ATP-binding protein [Paenibacillus oenotherae]MBW7476741.1 ABC transporter ATP-binding protein/permease [Paenibacillus oenotherae]
MEHIWFYIKKLHTFAGMKLYINLLGMIAISFFEGFGIYLLVPMLSLIGVIDLAIDNIPFLSWLPKVLGGIPERFHLTLVLAAYIVLIIGQSLLARKQNIMNSEIQQSFIRYLRVSTYKSLLQADWLFYLQKRRSDISHIMTSELARVSQGSTLALRLATTFVFTMIQVAFALLVSVQLTVLVMASGLLLAVFSRKFLKNAKKIGDQTTELSQHYYAGITDHFNGIKDIKSNRMEQSHLDWFRSLCHKMERNIVNYTKLQTATQLIYSASSAVLIVLFIYLAFEVLQVRPEQLMLIVVIFARLWPKFVLLQNNMEQIISTVPGFKSLIELQQECDHASEMKIGGTHLQRPIPVEQGILCSHVHFRYDRSSEEYALQDINVFIPANRMTAIVGKSGAGKSTLIDVLIGLIKPEAGEILIDGSPLDSERLQRMRSSVSYVSQDPFLFHATIRDNLLMAEPDASEDELWEALKFSASDEFVRRLPEGIDTIVGDRGVRLSGGERQRIVLARAILRRPYVLVLDEATSALDNENEAKIRAALENLKGYMTIIVIAHRLSTIRFADQVIVLERGRIVQQGGFQQLSGESKGSFSQMLAYGAEPIA